MGYKIILKKIMSKLLLLLAAGILVFTTSMIAFGSMKHASPMQLYARDSWVRSYHPSEENKKICFGNLRETGAYVEQARIQQENLQETWMHNDGDTFYVKYLYNFDRDGQIGQACYLLRFDDNGIQMVDQATYYNGTGMVECEKMTF